VSTIAEHFLPPASGLVPGSLCVLRDGAGLVRPAIVADEVPGQLLLQLSSVPDWTVGQEVTVGWSLLGRLRGIEARVLERDAASFELVLAIGRPADEGGERREVTRFALYAEALLVLDGLELSGRAYDVSVLGAGLLVPGPGPVEGDVGELLLHDAGQALLPGVRVRVAFARSDAPGLVRVGVEYDDPSRCADATVRLLSAIDAYACGQG
jgi:hypothetical protein